MVVVCLAFGLNAETILTGTCETHLQWGVTNPSSPAPSCDYSVGDYGVLAAAGPESLYVSGFVSLLRSHCIGCGDEYIISADVSFSHSEMITLPPIGGIGWSRLVEWPSEWQDSCSGDAGCSSIAVVVPPKIDRSLPFDIWVETSAFGNISADSESGSGLYAAGSNVRAWRIIPIPEPSTYALFGSGLLALLFFRSKHSAKSTFGR
jgi:hypothetical protein